MTTAKNLKRLLAEHSRLDGERVRHEQMAVSLQAEEKKLMDTVNLENKDEFEKVSQLRLRREIVPRKIKSYEEAAEFTKRELAAECEQVVNALLSAIDTKIKALTAKIAKALEPFFPDDLVKDIMFQTAWNTKSFSIHAADEIVPITTNGERLIAVRNRVIGTNFQDFEPIKKANELMEHVSVVAAVEI